MIKCTYWFFDNFEALVKFGKYLKIHIKKDLRKRLFLRI